MIFILRTLMISCCLGLLIGCQAKPDDYDSQGKPVRFSAYHGRFILINYWASWCKPCWQEIPALNTFAKQYTQKVVVFGVNFDQTDAAKLPALIQKMHIQFPVLAHDPAQHFGWSEVTGLPTTYVLNPQGKLIATLQGEQTQDSLKKALGLA